MVVIIDAFSRDVTTSLFDEIFTYVYDTSNNDNQAPTTQHFR